jgi:uncharacterized protein (TIGR00268 family)
VEQLGERALAITGVSPALAPHLRAEAAQQAQWLGLRHRELATAELADPAYASNPADRCYACKRELHRVLAPIAAAAGPGAVLVDGVNADDLGDHRPGLQAGREAGVRSPLAAAGIDKAGVRQLSRALPMANRSPQGDCSGLLPPRPGCTSGVAAISGCAVRAKRPELKWPPQSCRTCWAPCSKKACARSWCRP